MIGITGRNNPDGDQEGPGRLAEPVQVDSFRGADTTDTTTPTPTKTPTLPTPKPMQTRRSEARRTETRKDKSQRVDEDVLMIGQCT